jgi:c-di-GMP-related signal transduction protein
MAVVYSLIRCYEAADWDEVASLAQRLGVTLSSIGNAYVESARWVAEVTGLVGA